MFQETLEAMKIMGFTEEEQICENCYQHCIQDIYLQVTLHRDANAEVNSVQNNHFAKLICVYERDSFSLDSPTYPKRDYWVEASSINSNDHLKPFFRTFQQLAWKCCKIIWFIFERKGTGSNSSYVLTDSEKREIKTKSTKQQLNCLKNVGLPEPSTCTAFTSQCFRECAGPWDANCHVPSDTWWQEQRPPVALEQLQQQSTSLTCISDRGIALASLEGGAAGHCSALLPLLAWAAAFSTAAAALSISLSEPLWFHALK